MFWPCKFSQLSSQEVAFILKCIRVTCYWKATQYMFRPSLSLHTFCSLLRWPQGHHSKGTAIDQNVYKRQFWSFLCVPVPWCPFEDCRWSFTLNMACSLKSSPLRNVGQMSFLPISFQSCIILANKSAHPHPWCWQVYLDSECRDSCTNIWNLSKVSPKSMDSSFYPQKRHKEV